MVDIYSIISKNIKYYRKMARITQQELADLSGHSPEYIRRIESNPLGLSFSLNIVSSIAKTLNIKTYLFFIERNDYNLNIIKKDFYEEYKEDFENYLGRILYIPENNKKEYIDNSKYITKMLDAYPNIRAVLRDKEARQLSHKEIEILIDILDKEDTLRMIEEKELFFTGGREAYYYFNRMGIINNN